EHLPSIPRWPELGRADAAGLPELVSPPGSSAPVLHWPHSRLPAGRHPPGPKYQPGTTKFRGRLKWIAVSAGIGPPADEYRVLSRSSRLRSRLNSLPTRAPATRVGPVR